MRIVVLQSSYVPWKGYFDLMRTADRFVILDTVQYTRNDWRNRNRIKTPSGPAWLTIPIRHDGQRMAIDRATIVPLPGKRAWAAHHWSRIEASYGRLPAFSEVAALLQPVYRKMADETFLSVVNRHFLEAVARALGIHTPLIEARDLPDDDDPNRRLIGICRALGATEYASGPTARAYLDLEAFRSAGITVHFADFDGYAPYPQPHGAFDHRVSIVDLLCSVGIAKAPAYLTSVCPPAGAGG